MLNLGSLAPLTRQLDRILMPAFSTLNVRNMFDDMVDVVNQLCDKWERYGGILLTNAPAYPDFQLRTLPQDRPRPRLHGAHS